MTPISKVVDSDVRSWLTKIQVATVPSDDVVVLPVGSVEPVLESGSESCHAERSSRETARIGAIFVMLQSIPACDDNAALQAKKSLSDQEPGTGPTNASVLIEPRWETRPLSWDERRSVPLVPNLNPHYEIGRAHV